MFKKKSESKLIFPTGESLEKKLSTIHRQNLTKSPQKEFPEKSTYTEGCPRLFLRSLQILHCSPSKSDQTPNVSFNSKFGYRTVSFSSRTCPALRAVRMLRAWTSRKLIWVCILSAGLSCSLQDFDQVTSLFWAPGS